MSLIRPRRPALIPRALTLTALACAVGQVCAQVEPTSLEAVVVNGKALSTRQAIAEKRAQMVVSDGVSADEVGSIPDFGLGEALQRVPGVSMILNNGRGEAQFMTLRGFNPDYNSVQVDGIALPSTETTRRTVSLDVLPSSLIKQATIYKTFTPEMEGNAIGGIASLTTRSALDKPGVHVGGRADLSRWTNERRLHGATPSGQLDGTISSTFGPDEHFGALLSASYYRRDSSSLNSSVDSYSYFASPGAATNATKLNPARQDVDGTIAVPDRLRWLSYDNVRTRRGLFGKLDFDDREHWRAHVTAGAFQHLNDEDRRAQWLQNATTATARLTIDPAGGSVATGQSQSDYAKFDQNRQLHFVDAGAEFQPRQDQLVDATLNRGKGSYRQDARLYTFVAANSNALAYRYTLTTGHLPAFQTPDAIGDASTFTQTENTAQRETSTNRLTTFKLNFAQNLQDGSSGWGFKTGLHLRDLRQDYNFDETKYVPTAGAAITLAAVGAAPPAVTPYSGEGRALLLPDPVAAQAYFDAHPGQYVLASTNGQNSQQRDFAIQERIAAGYAMAVFRKTGWSGLLGLRYERTSLGVDTFTPTPANQTSIYSPSSSSRHYGDWLPSANVIADLTEQLRVRAGASVSLARPSYAQLGQNSNSVSGTTISQTLANPALAPRRSANLDLSAEWYWSRDTLLAVAVFNKDITGEIANLTSTQTNTISGTLYTVNTTQARNVGAASVTGAEFGFVATRFSSLPAPLNQFGASTNLTLLSMNPSTITMSDGRQRQMPSLMESPNMVLNASLLWGTGPLSAQLSYNRTGRTLISLSTSSAVQDVYYGSLGTVDAQLAYRPIGQMAVVLQAKNLTGARPRRVTGPSQGLLNQEIDNGRALFLGVTYAM